MVRMEDGVSDGGWGDFGTIKHMSLLLTDFIILLSLERPAYIDTQNSLAGLN